MRSRPAPDLPGVRVPVICVVTRVRGAAGSPERATLMSRLRDAAAAGASMIQVRERQMDDRTLLHFVGALRDLVRDSNCRIVVNDRMDLALAGSAHGVHLKSDAPAASDLRPLSPPGFLIGRSVHSTDDAVAAERAGGCDYLVFGTVFQSSSKPEEHPIAGLSALADVCRHVRLPVIAIGGVTPARAADAMSAGAAGVAAIGLFSESRDVADTLASLRAALTPNPGNV